MKKLIVLALLIGIIPSLFAQVKEGVMSMSQGDKNGLSILLKKTEKKSVEKEWMSFLKDYKGKTKKAKKSDELMTDDAMIKGMSSNTVDIYSSVVSAGEDTRLTVWYDLGGAYLSSSKHAEGYAVADKMLNKFSLKVSRGLVEEELKMQENEMKKLEKDLAGLKKDKEQLEADIVKYEEKIKQAKADIETNLANQKNKESEITSQADVVKEVKEKLKKLD